MSIPIFWRNLHLGFIERMMRRDGSWFLEKSACTPYGLDSQCRGEFVWLAGQWNRTVETSHPSRKQPVATRSIEQLIRVSHSLVAWVRGLPHMLLFRAGTVGTILRNHEQFIKILPFLRCFDRWVWRASPCCCPNLRNMHSLRYSACIASTWPCCTDCIRTHAGTAE